MCPRAQQGIIYIHVMKVFKFLHPNVLDGVVVRDVGTYHGVQEVP
jgi:hypothetical protein